MFGRKKLKSQIERLVIEKGILKSKLEAQEGLFEKNKKLKEENKKLKEENQELTTQNNLIKQKIREQTEADVYFSCVKIMKELENGKKKEDLKEQIAYRDRLSNALTQQQMASPPQSHFLQALGAAGGSMLGRNLNY